MNASSFEQSAMRQGAGDAQQLGRHLRLIQPSFTSHQDRSAAEVAAAYSRPPEPPTRGSHEEFLASAVADHIASYLSLNNLHEAHRVLDAALSAGLSGPRLERLSRLLHVDIKLGAKAEARPAPAQAQASVASYAGQWVALVDGRVVASAKQLSDLRAVVKFDANVVFHWVVSDSHIR